MVGVGAGAGAYALWGLLTLYWPLLEPAGALEILVGFVLVWAALLLLSFATVRSLRAARGPAPEDAALATAADPRSGT